jgi:hypothetical protein
MAGRFAHWRRPCERHADRVVYDIKFRSRRCCYCGHRITTDGQLPVQTRELPVQMWIPELRGRRWAKRTRLGCSRISSS